MTGQVLEVEGTWEEIVALSEKFAGRRVRIILLANEDEEALPSPEESFRQAWLEIKTGKTRPVSELWEGIDAAIEMMESLPENLQQQVAEYLKEYIAQLKDELQWDESFEKTQPQLVAAAQQAKQEIVLGDETLKSAEECFRQGWYEAMTGQTIPLSELWDGIDAESLFLKSTAISDRMFSQLLKNCKLESCWEFRYLGLVTKYLRCVLKTAMFKKEKAVDIDSFTTFKQ
ncbi:hypothetical protein [Microcoleus sp. PH2017_05_CCC_O_A]|uniref:hypothetical protein n=2 Tax=Microcoleus TaxID=44471 RepID=UPI0025D0FFC6|nr:hypothetical protein [Microcoleus sp. PH2017_05_CCC_O_A]